MEPYTKYYLQNREKCLERIKKYRENNKEKVNQLSLECYYKNKEYYLQKSKEYYEQNKEKAKSYYEQNKEKRLEYQKIYCKKKEVKIRNRQNIYFKLRIKLQNRIQDALKKSKTERKTKTVELLGCSVKKLREHIEQQWQPGMSWDNYGLKGWHIDHIKPCNTFDLTNIEEQKKCFHYTNLRPLWAKDNLRRPRDGSDIC